MPDADAIRATIDSYVKLFSAGDREAWLDLFADGATMEDPVGTPLKTTREEIGDFYDSGRKAADSVELRPTAPPIVVGDQAAFAFDVRPSLGGNTLVIPAIDVMTFDDDARITSQRAFVDFSMMRPATD
jgi:steroid delta-isomerase